jgi:FHS family L-fucose permease-like MFS transporter
MAVNLNSNHNVNETLGKKSYGLALYSLMLLFFMMGFITCLNDILIPYLKSIFALTYAQANFINLCFFGAYFFMSIPAGYIIDRIGYKGSMILGFVIASIGCFLFFPAAGFKVYGLFLAALFILASGITLLQVAGNPYVAILGKPETASARLTLTQAFNYVGTTIAPYFGSI